MAIPRIRTAARLGFCAVIATVWQLVPLSAQANPSHELLVPKDYPTIQAAVDAAQPGDRIRVRPGVYREQVVIDKNVSITGSGAPQTLVAGEDGGTSIVEIHDGASVALSQLAVSGPGSGTCSNGALGSGIRVLGGARLDLGHARVTTSPTRPQCLVPAARSPYSSELPRRNGFGDGPRFRDLGLPGLGAVTVLNQGSNATLVNSTVTGHPRLSTDGIGFLLGAVGRVTRNTISGNDCREPDPACGPDFFSETQHVGIAAGTGTVIEHNRLTGNHVGIYAVGGSDSIGHNDIIRSSYFGMALQDGSFTLECCGFNATVSVQP
ncbi:nitrous oxide reductase family maturation protein NosD [Streptomyces sp. NPDC057011]|uniref:right-handed parallel beta-helix repeat-containing protein n=1 Tax=unclassified Streptomyces TaxID=2593676 RepID=UPI003638079E